MKGLTKAVLLVTLGTGSLIAADQFKQSDLVQNFVRAQYSEMHKKTSTRILQHAKSKKGIYVPRGTGFYDLIDAELGNKDSKLRKLKEEHGWKKSDLADAYKTANNGKDLDYSTVNFIPSW